VAVDLPITLGQFVKVAGFAATGGEAKEMVLNGQVRLNEVIETSRGKKMSFGDVVATPGGEAVVTERTGPQPE
jgi:ribosome-associated protein